MKIALCVPGWVLLLAICLLGVGQGCGGGGEGAPQFEEPGPENPEVRTDSGTTGADGRVTVSVGGGDQVFEFRDQQTDEPIEGLDVTLGEDGRNAVLFACDPQGRYAYLLEDPTVALGAPAKMTQDLGDWIPNPIEQKWVVVRNFFSRPQPRSLEHIDSEIWRGILNPYYWKTVTLAELDDQVEEGLALGGGVAAGQMAELGLSWRGLTTATHTVSVVGWVLLAFDLLGMIEEKWAAQKYLALCYDSKADIDLFLLAEGLVIWALPAEPVEVTEPDYAARLVGVVRDAETGEPIHGVHIASNHSSQYAVTADDGFYDLQMMVHGCAEPDQVAFVATRPGYPPHGFTGMDAGLERSSQRQYDFCMGSGPCIGEWVEIGTGPGSHLAVDVAPLTDGSCVVAGNFWGAMTLGHEPEGKLMEATQPTAWVARYAADGRLLWASELGATYGTSAAVYLDEVLVLPDGSAVVAGQFLSELSFEEDPESWTFTTAASAGDGFLARYQPSGALSWVAEIDSTPNASVDTPLVQDLRLALSTDGSVLVMGRQSGTATFGGGQSPPALDAANLQHFVARYSTDGTCQWARRVNPAGDVLPKALAPSTLNGFLLGGVFTGTVQFGSGEAAWTLVSEGALDGFYARYTADGTLDWVDQVGGDGAASVLDVVSLPQGHFALRGVFHGTVMVGSGESAAEIADINGFRYVAKCSPEGVPLWIRQNDNPSSQPIHLAGLRDGSVSVSGCIDTEYGFFTVQSGSGRMALSGGTGTPLYTLTFDSDGELVHSAVLGGERLSDVAVPHAICEALGGHLLIVGAFAGEFRIREGGEVVTSSSTESQDALVVQLRAAR